MTARRVVAVLGAGFIGLNLVRRLVSGDSEVAVLDHNPAPADLVGRVRWIRGEFADPKAIAQVLEGAGVAFHLVSGTVPGDDHVQISPDLTHNISATLRPPQPPDRPPLPPPASPPPP